MDSIGYGSLILALSIIGAASLLLIGGCAQNAPYHTNPGASGNCQGEKADEEGCTQAYYQEHHDYDLAFVEFSERGNAFNDRYVDDVLNRIRQKVQQDGAVLIVFVHGWKHNASETDKNVEEFEKTLLGIKGELRKEFGNNPKLAKRQLIGIYVGWRGKSLQVPGLINATFWDRKATAEEVGKGGVTSLLLELKQILEDKERELELKNEPDLNVLVVVGHSFGGAIVVSALNEVLTERVIKRHPKQERHPKQGLARTIMDGVIVINPAIEAAHALPFVEAAIQAPYQPEQRPIFVSLSSDADWPTHYTFPIGQTLGLLTWKQTDLKRRYLRDRGKSTQELTLREKHLDTTTIGNFAPFLTHRLTKREDNGESYFNFQTCKNDPEGCKPKGLTTLSGQPFIEKLPQNYPLYFIKTDATVMSGHNDIFNPAVRAFLVTVIDDVVRGKFVEALDYPPVPSILTRPDDLVQQIQKRYAEISPDSPP